MDKIGLTLHTTLSQGFLLFPIILVVQHLYTRCICAICACTCMKGVNIIETDGQVNYMYAVSIMD